MSEVLEKIANQVCLYTDGDWTDEAPSQAELDRRLEQSGCFKIYREVWGQYLQPRMDQERAQSDEDKEKRPRIDRVLAPTMKLISSGWELGHIGIECKKSGHKLGPAVCQLLDYSRVVWELPHGFRAMCQWSFLWPMQTAGGDIGSIMAQHRIGTCSGGSHRLLSFMVCGSGLLYIGNDGTPDVRRMNCGRKVGSR